MSATSVVPSRLIRVLIVEDESRLRSLLTDVIPDMGYPASAARTAEEAMKIMESDPHDVLILDLQLPAMNGMTLFKTMRERWPDVQVIVVTGYGDLESAREAIHLDVVDFLGKPCHLKSLEVSLERARQRIEEKRERAGAIEAAEIQAETPTDGTLEAGERVQILAALKKNAGNRTATALELGISRRTLHYKLSAYQQQGFSID